MPKKKNKAPETSPVELDPKFTALFTTDIFNQDRLLKELKEDMPNPRFGDVMKVKLEELEMQAPRIKIKKRKTREPVTSQISTQPESKSNNAFQFDQYLCMNSFKMKPINEKWIQWLAQELIKWAVQDDNALKLTQFYTLHGICSADIRRWMERSDYLKRAHAFAKLVIGDRREVGAINRKYETTMIKMMMPAYDPEWAQREQEQSKLRNPDAQAMTGQLIIEIPVFKSSGLVPDRQLEEPADMPIDPEEML